MGHICDIFDIMHQHCLFVMHSKCAFGKESISYQGHIVSAPGMAMDPAKVQAIVEWPQPRCACAVYGFLGLADYYRKFVQDYGIIAAPHTALLRKEGFS
jgi:hypothetical protein